MAANIPSAALTRDASEKDLQTLSRLIGSNWEMLAPFLLGEGSMTQVDHIKDDHRGTTQRIFYLLLSWRRQTDDPSLAHLFHLMYKAGTCVTIEWRSIAGKLGVQLGDVRACKDGYQQPVQSAIGEGMEIDYDIISVNNNAADDIRSVRQRPPQQPMEGVQESGSDAINTHYLYERQSAQSSSDRGQVSVNRGQVSSNSGQVSMDGGQSSADGGQTSVERGQSSVDGRQPSSSHQDLEFRQRSDKDACCYDGRLIELSEDEIVDLERENTILIGQGTFGDVYRSSNPSKIFGMHVAVKKIKLSPEREGSIRREMITSRINHPFILPLLAVAEKKHGTNEFWFVSPYCQEGDLKQAIANGNINAPKRVRILLQIAAAIKYIHTPVAGVREVILHKDISSKNVILDEKFNARLIDFGSAREKDDVTDSGFGKLCYSHLEYGSNKPAKESWDYFAFGVIIREMLTSLGPQGCEITSESNFHLKRMDAEDVKARFDMQVWGSNIGKAIKLNTFAEKLLKDEILTVKKFTTEVVDELEKMSKSFGQLCIADVIENGRCHICMINKKANKSSMKHSNKTNCQQKIEVCIACEKNSYLNPIECYCGEKLTPAIGSKWGALLVAGKDNDDVEVTKALTKDVKEIKKLLTSHAPRVFGIGESDVRTVIPSSPDKLNDDEKLWPKVRDAVQYFTEASDSIDTLLIFFTCHGSNEQATNKFQFKLGSSSDSISINEFEEILDCLKDINKLIIILDRCYPPLVKFKKSSRVYIQINSSKENEKAEMDGNGSFFTKWFIRGLKAKSELSDCTDSNCTHCADYWKMNTNFITVHSLYDYIKGHLRKQTPVRSIQLYDHDSSIAYYTGVRMFLNFKCRTFGSRSKKIPLEFLQDIEELKNKLKQEFSQNLTNDQVTIWKDTYRKKERKTICDNLDTVMDAWVQRQELEVVFGS